MNAAIIVAHPDDETIWSGGLILKHPEWDWTVLCLSRADDADRRPKFERVCDLLGVRRAISDLDDSNPPKRIDRGREIGGRIIRFLGGARWDLCMTHGDNGEYGHLRHKQTHREVMDLVRDGVLECDELWTFAYRCGPDGADCRLGRHADIVVDLTERELYDKRRIVRQGYGYGEDSFEVRACISPEGFRRRSVSRQELRP